VRSLSVLFASRQNFPADPSIAEKQQLLASYVASQACSDTPGCESPPSSSSTASASASASPAPSMTRSATASRSWTSSASSTPSASVSRAPAAWPQRGHDATRCGDGSSYDNGAVGPRNFAVAWRFSASRGVSVWPPVTSRGGLVFAAAGSVVYALDASSMQEMWQYVRRRCLFENCCLCCVLLRCAWCPASCVHV
jgi:hypothetical protein